MPVIHSATFSALPTTTSEQIAAVHAATQALATIPGCVWLKFGATLPNERAKGYTHQLVAEFESIDAVKAYVPHPTHKAFVEGNIQYFDSSKTIILDFEY
ncbi:hypothetical protein HK100_011777 [Physocladia obscura]|uniref:Stress-response A/B barrel domain-containing protein n=1 Tax=Physocladia obscura TaxID=109957 RepID=A0AAD5T9C8_9FUNG|nr:hypothetical protein HK100_011777 [Physocladia obscura]